MGGFGGLTDKVKGLASKHSSKVEQGIEKVGDTVDKRTGGKYSQHVDKAQLTAQKLLDSTTKNEGGTAPRV